jgi:DNA-binding response OmpR family regulator
MRPKKVLLLALPNDDELSVLKFMLETNGFRVIPAPNGEAAIRAFKENAVDLVLADATLPLVGKMHLISRLKIIAIHIPMILLRDSQTVVLSAADAVLSKGISNYELLERIKIMSARKQGPRKGSLSAIRCGEHSKAVPA